MTAVLMWTIYDHPVDYPDGFVVRKWSVEGDDIHPLGTSLFPTLIRAREFGVPAGRTRIPRRDDDDPVIVETWI